MQFLLSRSTDPGFNLAAEEYLFLRQPVETLFVYVNRPCVVVGCNQALQNEADKTYCETRDIGLFRRLSGGGAVYHDEGNLNFCFVRNRITGVSALDGTFLVPVVAALQDLGIPAVAGPRKDLWLEGFKISGTASHVGKAKSLQHGTLLFDTNLEDLHAALSAPSGATVRAAVASVPSPVTNIRAFLCSIGREDLSMEAFLKAFCDRLCVHAGAESERTLSAGELEEINRLADETYRSPAWTFKK